MGAVMGKPAAPAAEAAEEAAPEEAAGAPPEAAAAAPSAPAEVAIEAPAYEHFCFGCGKGFMEEAEVRTHMHGSVDCLGDAWQAAVQVMACLPGAGTALWCPACPDDFIGKWSGKAARAGALLRHAKAASAADCPHAAAHNRLQQALLELFHADPPPRRPAAGVDGDLDADEEEEWWLAFEAWASASRLLGAAGPLLANRSREARLAILQLQDEVLGPDASGAAAELSGESKAAEDLAAASVALGDEKASLRILGLDLTVEGSGLYDDDIPLEGGGGDPGPHLDAACVALPPGGTDGLRNFDLTLSDSEDEAPPSAPAAPAEAGATDTTFL